MPQDGAEYLLHARRCTGVEPNRLSAPEAPLHRKQCARQIRWCRKNIVGLHESEQRRQPRCFAPEICNVVDRRQRPGNLLQRKSGAPNSSPPPYRPQRMAIFSPTSNTAPASAPPYIQRACPLVLLHFLRTKQ